ncbi:MULTISPECIES: hypothetical protein [Acidianus]|uniref:Uncharacterized protein n=1 Tax=Candidatus Acidianus copahuensis TaxID=1160895 RepID=A0A031LR33_9CREN|nr:MULTISPECIES: hypothetical protein [Acidianus]EZQ10847.1 hypothetical protein CM19_03165 [Candidatus Acidianus copahuensis]NON61235.1 hypothetical protein [Acidianus sp. RZ1]
MTDLDLSNQSGGCGSNSPALTLMKFWLEVGGNQKVSVIAQEGVQADQVEMWAAAMQEKGVKILNKTLKGNKIIYEIFLP